MAVGEAIDARFPVPLLSKYSVHEWQAERSFGHPLGFGGKTDLCADDTDPPIVLDFKSKDVVDDRTRGYDEQAMQLAAYREGLGYPDATCANVFVTRSEPWTVRIHVWTEEELQRAWVMFKCLLSYHKAQTKYDAAFEVVG